MRTVRSRIASILAGLLIAIAGAAPAMAASGPGSGLGQSIVPYGSAGYRYDTVSPDALPGFEAIDFDDTGFAAGAGIFGTAGGCAYDDQVVTAWSAGDDLLVRRSFDLPDDDRELRVGLLLARDAEVFVNGVAVTDGFVRGSVDCPGGDAIVVTVPDELLDRGGANLLAIRARAPAPSEPGGSARAFLDVELRLIESLANDHRADATTIASLPYVDTIGLERATLESSEPQPPGCETPTRTAWYRFVAPSAGSFVFGTPDEAGSGPSPFVAHFVDDGGSGLTFVGCRASGLSQPFGAITDEVHFFQVGRNEASRDFAYPATFSLDVAPAIQPDFRASQTILALLPAVFVNETVDPANGQVASTTWTFGDGGTSDESYATHRFFSTGTYDVTLTVTMTDGRTGTITKSIQVFPYDGDPLVAQFYVSPNPTYAGGTSQLADASVDPAGLAIVDRQWSFGDGETGSGPSPTHVWTATGDYDVSLTVTTEDGRTAQATQSVSVVVPPPPGAEFGFWPSEPNTASEIQFQDQSSDPLARPITGWAWQFGDGSTSSLSGPTHRFTNPGSYDVELTVTTDDGRSASTTKTIVVSVPPDPIAGIGWYPFDPSIVDTVQFIDGSNDPAGGSVAAWAWDFGDGATSTVAYPTHRYVANGTFTVRLTITTADGRTDSTEAAVTVSTHDVSIKSLSAPRSASSGQTKAVTVDLVSKRSAERVEIQLFRSTVGGYEFVGSQIVQVQAKGTSKASFDVKFTSADALIGKVTFRAYAQLLDARDAIPADNEAISAVTKVTK